MRILLIALTLPLILWRTAECRFMSRRCLNSIFFLVWVELQPSFPHSSIIVADYAISFCLVNTRKIKQSCIYCTLTVCVFWVIQYGSVSNNPDMWNPSNPAVWDRRFLPPSVQRGGSVFRVMMTRQKMMEHRLTSKKSCLFSNHSIMGVISCNWTLMVIFTMRRTNDEKNAM